MEIAFLTSLLAYRVAFVVLAALVVGTAIPLAYAWARLLPEDAPPFKIEPGSVPSPGSQQLEQVSSKRRKLDVLSIVLLLCITATYAIRFPGSPIATLTQWTAAIFPVGVVAGIVATVRFVLVVGTALAACLATVRPGPMRVPLVTAAALALTLWLLGPILLSALLAG